MLISPYVTEPLDLYRSYCSREIIHHPSSSTSSSYRVNGSRPFGICIRENTFYTDACICNFVCNFVRIIYRITVHRLSCAVWHVSDLRVLCLPYLLEYSVFVCLTVFRCMYVFLFIWVNVYSVSFSCFPFFVFFMHFCYSLCHVYGPSCLIQINVCMYV